MTNNFPDQEKKYQVWQTTELSKTFLEGVRGAIPLANEQIDCMLRIINLTQPKVNKFLDLGCGNGILGKAIYQQYPQGEGVFLDISDTMIQKAQENIFSEGNKIHFLLQDFGQKNWLDSVNIYAPFDVIVSGFSIHHQPDQRKKEIYQEIYSLLKDGGLFLNLEHVASHSQLGEDAFNELFIDALYSYHKNKGSTESREAIAQQYYNRGDKNANILTLLETQCNWLREIGFINVDCYMKIFEIALFGGTK